MKQEKKPEMSLIEQHMRKATQLEKEGKSPTPTRFVGLLPKTPRKPKKNVESSGSKE